MNHRSAWDMIVYVAILPRRIKFLAKKELFHIPVLKWIVARWCIPIDRGRYDRKALDLCSEALRQGYVLSIFPEGTRHAGLAIAHGGAVLLAARTGVPLVPGAIMGAYGPMQTLTIRFGQPMRFPPHLTRQQRQAETDRLLATIRGLGATPPQRRPRRRARFRIRSRRLRSGGHDDGERAG
jgi:1-acyl-sn-glycerol-3-phosphate acyltransferase